MESQCRSILIVDDEYEIREVLSDLLASLRYDIVMAANGAEAISAIETREFDVILSDIAMPGLSGFDLLVHLKSKAIDTPFVIMTGFADREKTLSALRLGAWDFLDKPFNHKVLIDVVVRAAENGMRRRRLHQALAEGFKAHFTEQQILLDKNYLKLSPIINNKKRSGPA